MLMWLKKNKENKNIWTFCPYQNFTLWTYNFRNLLGKILYSFQKSHIIFLFFLTIHLLKSQKNRKSGACLCVYVCLPVFVYFALYLKITGARNLKLWSQIFFLWGTKRSKLWSPSIKRVRRFFIFWQNCKISRKFTPEPPSMKINEISIFINERVKNHLLHNVLMYNVFFY